MKIWKLIKAVATALSFIWCFRDYPQANIKKYLATETKEKHRDLTMKSMKNTKDINKKV